MNSEVVNSQLYFVKMLKFPSNPFHKIDSIEDSVNKHLKGYQPLTNLPTIPDFFENRDILITGSSSYLGKALVEKILRSCPKIGRIFLLLRPSGGDSVAEKFCSIKNSAIFDIVRISNQFLQRKLFAIEGDLEKFKLGLAPASLAKLENVSIIFHIGAAKFDENLRTSILTTTRGTREMLEFSLKLKSLKLFCHISSAFSGLSDISSIIDEKISTPTHDWKETIRICEKMDQTSFDSFADIFNGFYKSNSSFSRNLAEHVVKDYSGRLPVVIMRPAIILFPVKEPFAGAPMR